MRTSSTAALLPLLMLAACADDAPPVDKRAGEAKQMQAGEYKVTARVTALGSTDKSVPATKAKIGDTIVTRGCVAADGTPDPKIFADAGDQCKPGTNYFSGAIVNLQLSCSRPGHPGYVTSAVDGSFTADSFKATVHTGTAFSGQGDYTIDRALTARRVGICPPAAAQG